MYPKKQGTKKKEKKKKITKKKKEKIESLKKVHSTMIEY